VAGQARPSLPLTRRWLITARRFSARFISTFLCALGEEVEDALDGLVGVVGVQRRQAQVAGFGEGDRRFHRRRVRISPIRIVRRFAHRVLQRVVEGMRPARPRAG
jgi:hypothetical protein